MAIFIIVSVKLNRVFHFQQLNGVGCVRVLQSNWCFVGCFFVQSFADDHNQTGCHALDHHNHRSSHVINGIERSMFARLNFFTHSFNVRAFHQKCVLRISSFTITLPLKIKP